MINTLLTFGAKSVDPKILEQTLTVRENTVNEIEKNCVRKIKNSTTWQSLIIAPRGCGKTHLIKVLYHRLKENKSISNKSLIAFMSEDEVGISNFTDLMVSIIRAFVRYYEPGSDVLEPQISEASLIKDANKRKIFIKDLLIKFAGDRIIILLIENFNNILDALGSQGQGNLRDFIHLYNNLSIIATSQNLIASIQDGKSPFYNFFNIFVLEKLNFEESVNFLEVIAKSEGYKEFANEIKKPEFESKLRAIFKLTEGNHRLLVTFYSFLKADFKSQLSDIFIKVMNDLKPYYEQFINALPPQQQKIVKHLSLNRMAISGKEIAIACFIEPNIISKQLSLLFEKGMVDKNKSGKDVFYELREPLMRICFEISENPDGISSLFVDFLNAYYERKILKEKYLMFKYGARFQDKEIKNKYEQEAHMYGLVLNELEKEQISFAHKVFNKIENYNELCSIIHSPKAGVLKHIDLSYECFKKGKVLIEEKKYMEAIKYYHQAAKLYPDNGNIFYHIGFAYQKLGKHKYALKNFQKAVELNLDDDNVYLNIGISFSNLEKYKEAFEAFQKAFELNPKNVRIFIGQGFAFSKLKQYEKAIESFQKAVTLNPEDVLGLEALGFTYFKLEKYKEAIEVLEKAKTLNPENHKVLGALGFSYNILKQFKEAIEVFEKVRVLNPENHYYLETLGFSYFNLNEYKKAIEVFEKVRVLNPENHKVIEALGFSFIILNQYEKAIEVLQKAVGLKPERFWTFIGLGISYSSLHQEREAIEAYQKAIRLNPKNELFFNQLGFSYFKLNKYEEAIETFRKSIRLNPKNDDTFYALGRAFTNLKKYNEAVKAYQAAIELNPEHEEAYNSLGLIYLKVDDLDRAIETFNKGLEINAENMNTNSSLLGAYIQINDQNKSKELITKLIKNVNRDLLIAYLSNDVLYNLFRFGSEAFIKSYFAFILKLLIKEKKEQEMWGSLIYSLFEILIFIEDYENERINNIEKTLTETLAEYKESIILLKMFKIGIGYLKNNEKNDIFKLSKEERKLFKEAILDKRESKSKDH